MHDNCPCALTLCKEGVGAANDKASGGAASADAAELHNVVHDPCKRVIATSAMDGEYNRRRCERCASIIIALECALIAVQGQRC